MNTNEIADEFRDSNIFWQPEQLLEWAYEAETMLRQQQAEIETLKTLLNKGCLDSKSYVIGWDDGKATNCACGEPFAPNTIHKKDTPCYEAEPIAWMNVEPAYLGWDKLREDDIPLYTAVVIKNLKE